MAGKEGLSSVPRASAEILALISQTCKPPVNSSSAGSRAAGCLGALLRSRVLVWPSQVSTCPYQEQRLCLSQQSHINAVMWLELVVGRETCLELGDLQDSSAKANSPPTGSHF